MSQIDPYAVLAGRHGYPDSLRYRRILEFVLTPDEAKLCLELPMPNEELAQKLNMDVETLKQKLEELFKRGLVFPRNIKTREGYRFCRSVEQLHDSTQTRLGVIIPEYHMLWEDFTVEEWEVDRAQERARFQWPGSRIIPPYKAIMHNPEILPSEDVRIILRESSTLAIVDCPCRKQRIGSGLQCETSSYHSNCVQLNKGAEHAIATGIGREITYEEALSILDSITDDGLISTYVNSSGIMWSAICNCCRDCCIMFTSIDKYGLPLEATLAKSRYEAAVDWELCKGCQTCVDRCMFDAIEMVKPKDSKKFKALVDTEKCWGCGVCIAKCETSAISLKLVRPPEHIPSLGLEDWKERRLNA